MNLIINVLSFTTFDSSEFVVKHINLSYYFKDLRTFIKENHTWSSDLKAFGDNKDNKDFLRYTMLGDGLVASEASKVLYKKEINHQQAASLHNHMKSNKSMSVFINRLFPEYEKMSTKRKADFLEGFIGYTYETKGESLAKHYMNIYNLYIYEFLVTQSW